MPGIDLFSNPNSGNAFNLYTDTALYKYIEHILYISGTGEMHYSCNYNQYARNNSAKLS